MNARETGVSVIHKKQGNGLIFEEQHRAVITATDTVEAAFVKGGVVADCTSDGEIHSLEDGQNAWEP